VGIKRIEQTDRFLIETETGERLEVVEFQEWIDAGTQELPGLKSYQRIDGGFITPKGDAFDVIVDPFLGNQERATRVEGT